MRNNKIKQWLIALLLFSSATAYCSDGFVVKNIVWQGFQRLTFGAVLLNMPVQVGDTINDDEITFLIRSLFATGYFDDVKVLRDANTLIIKVKERPSITNIILYGNQWISNKILQKQLANLHIQVGELLDRNKIYHLENEIKKKYYSIGKYNAQVKTIITQLPRNRVNLQFIVAEGLSAHIQQINFIGNKKFTTSQLVSLVKLRDNLPWWKIITKYEPATLDSYLSKLRYFYLERGYANFKIDFTKVSITPDKNSLYITINITEGDQYTIAGVDLNGETVGYDNQILSLINIPNNSLYNGTVIHNMEITIHAFLGRYGYAYPIIFTHNEIHHYNKTIQLHVHVDAGSRYYVRNIIFLGNYISKDSILRREIRQMEGTWLVNDLVTLGKERLKRTGFFATVDVAIQRVPDTPDKVDIFYKVKERNIGSINFGMGLEKESGIIFQGGLQEDNWLGTGNAVGFSASNHNNSTSAEVSMTYPYFIIHGIHSFSFGSKIFYHNFLATENNYTSFNNRTYGIDSIWSVPIHEKHTFQIGLGIVHNSLSNLKPQLGIWRYFKSMNKPLNFDDHTKYNMNDFNMHFSWIYNNYDSVFLPTTGHKTSINTHFSIPRYNNAYYKMQLETSQYYPIDEEKTWILLGRAQFCYGNGFGSQELPFYENFYAGGLGTVRGFGAKSIGPKAIYLQYQNGVIKPESGSPSKDSVGGNIMAIASLELMIPTPFIKQQDANDLKTSFFIDAGTVWDGNWHNTLASWKTGMPDYGKASHHIQITTGITLQWMSPIGPIVFSYAKPINYDEWNQLEPFQLKIGKIW